MRLAVVCSLVLLAACSRSPRGVWRDQFLFLGDDGVVAALVSQRSSPDQVEFKGWLSGDGQAMRTFYYRGALAGDLRDVTGVIERWSKLPGTPARVSLTQGETGLTLRMRTPAITLGLQSAPPLELARHQDPEGTSIYAAARATLALGTNGDRESAGWLLIESTPSGQPRSAEVDFGEFMFVAVASPTQLVFAKHSATRRGFNFAAAHGDVTRSGTDATLAMAADQLLVAAPGLAVDMSIAVADRQRSLGTAANGDAIGYEVLLLRDAEHTGIAFTIGLQRAP